MVIMIRKLGTRDGSGDHSDISVNRQPAIPEHQDSLTLERSPKATPAVPKKVKDERKPARENYKTIPVVPENEIGEKKASTYRTFPVMKENDEKNTGMSGTKEATKKSTNGSRSPSPPTGKDGDTAKKDVKEAQSRNLEQYDARHTTVSDGKEKSRNEMKGMSSGNETVQAASVEYSCEEELPTRKHDDKRASRDAMKEKNKDMTVVESEAAKDEDRTFRSNLSEPDAAVRIQSAYRGYDVRRWQPLEKLRKIMNVQEQMKGVKKQLQCLEVPRHRSMRRQRERKGADGVGGAPLAINGK
nr:unnamed protein product [Digitaria exilis]